MSRRSGSTRVIAAFVVGSTVALLSATPAAAEVCDKEEVGFAGWLGLVMVLGTIAFFSAYARGRIWPALAGAGLIVLMIAAAFNDLAQGEPVTMAAWREGCGRSNFIWEIATTIGLILLGFLGRRQFRARSGPIGDAATPNDEKV